MSRLRIAFVVVMTLQRFTLGDSVEIPLSPIHPKNEGAVLKSGCRADGQYIINSAEQYAALRAKFRACDKNADLGDLVVKYADHTVLGQYTEGTCVSDFKPRVFRDDTSKHVQFVVAIFTMDCTRSFKSASLNLVQLPKIPSDYKIEFLPPSGYPK
jgi:hypothetical protein